MLLQALYEFSERNNLLDGQAFEEHAIRWIIPIDAEGNLIGDGLIDTSTPEQKKGKIFSCPVTIRPKNFGTVSEFLADGHTALFGFDKSGESERDESSKAVRKCEDYWRLIEESEIRNNSLLLQAMLKWRNKHFKQNVIPFLRWGVKKEGEKEKWWVKTPTEEIAMGAGDYFTFSVDGQIVVNDPVLRKDWIQISQKERAEQDQDSRTGLCLITGNRNIPIQRSHPKIFGLPGALGMGAYLVSFSSNTCGDVCAFSSFGWKKGENVPISTYAAESYAAALNYLVSQKRHNIRMGPAILCFWTRKHSEYIDMLSLIMNEPTVESVQNFFKRWKAGVNEPLQDQDHFYSLMLTGNAGRLVVRRWLDQPLSEASGHLEQWFQDLSIQRFLSPLQNVKKKKKGEDNPSDTPLPFSLFRLACTTVRESKDLIAEVPIRLFTAAWKETLFP